MSAPASSKSARDHSVDALRAFLILLGIPYHAAFLYSATSDWPVADTSRSWFFDIVTEAIHSFRIPAFFIIAGYFTALVLLRRSEKEWLRGRLRFLALPLVSAVVFIMPICMMLTSAATSDGASFGHPNYWPMATSQLSTPGFHWIGHLWFLIVLLQYCLIVYFTWTFIKRLPFSKLDTLLAKRYMLTMLSLALFIFVYQALRAVPTWVLAEIVPKTALEMASFDQFVKSAPFFLIGISLLQMPKMWANFKRYDLRIGLIALAAVAVSVATHHEATVVEKLVHRLAFGFSSIFVTSYLLGVFGTFFNKESRLVSSIVDAALVVYIVHFPVVLALGLVTRTISLNIYAEYIVVVPLVYLISFALAFALNAVFPLRFLFTGKS